MLDTDGNNGRLLRSGLIAHMLDAQGHSVTWWMSTFDHANRRARATASTERPFGKRGSVRMVHSPGYTRSVSLARLRDHAVWGRAFRRAIEAVQPPDIILCSYPTIEAAVECVAYGAKWNVPVVVDLRDMWPDIFSEYLPAALRPFARALLSPWRSRARAALRNATALFAITDEFLDWGLALAGRPRKASDAAFLLAYPETAAEPTQGAGAAQSYWDERGVSREGCFNVVLIGSMTKRRFEMETVISAARELRQGTGKVKFVIAGDGDDLAEYRREAQDCDTVIFPGWLSAERIRALLGRAHLGLVPYRNTPDYVMSVPNKVGEYLAAGVPVASCLGGTLERLLARWGCGLQFEARRPSSLAALVRELAADEPRRVRLSERALSTYREELSAGKVYGRLIAQLEAIAAAQPVLGEKQMEQS